MHAIAGRDARDSTSAPVPVPDELLHLPTSGDEAVSWLSGKRFGLPREYFVTGMDPDVERRIRESVAFLEDAGATVEDVSLPHTDYGLGTYALSAGYYDAFYVKAQKVRTLIKRDFDQVFAAGIDALVAPTSPSVAFRFGSKMSDPVSMYLADACTLPVNMAGLPGI